MAINPKAFDKTEQNSFDAGNLLRQYGVGAIRFAGAPDALYERHLKFDNVVEPESSDSRERYEAAARSVRDILSDRWLRTDETYAREIQPRLGAVTIPAISAALGVSEPYGADIRAGRRCPHPRHWLALARLVGVQPRC